MAVNEIITVRGKNSVSARTAQEWYKKIRDGCGTFEDARSSRPVEFDEKSLIDLVEAEPTLTMDMTA